MSDNRSVDAVFCAAIEIESSSQRESWLNQACGEDAELRRQVDRLLQAHFRGGSIVDSPAHTIDPTVDQPPAERPGARIGPYKLLQQIGEGGMGTVYMAEQAHPVQRKVALKVIKTGMDSRQIIARFEAERQALAMMDHVNIARVLDAGTTESGLPYFVMELVHGVPITKYCDDNQLTPRERLELFVPVCQAIQHAHQKGIIHRDIKPSNVMVTLYDGKPVPKVIDFGVAKATEQKLTERTLFTQYGTMVGTLEYMSPEQAEMSALGVDTRSDIFSLGVLLYELLTGSTPLSNKRLKEAAYAEILRMIKEEDPPKPSTRLSESGEALASISAQRHTEPAKLSKLMRGELDWIVMKTLEKDRNRRYETANGFAMDVQRYLNDEAVQACPPSARYRLRKFARRNRVAMMTTGLVALALVAGTVVSAWQAIRATHARGLAQERLEAETIALNKAETAQQSADKARANEAAQRVQAVQERDRAVKAEQQAEAARKDEAKQRGIAEANELLARRRFYAAQMNLGMQAFEAGDTPRVLQLLETQRPKYDEEDLRAFEWYCLWQRCHQPLRFSRTGNPGTTQTVAFSPDSTMLALAGSDGNVQIYDVATGEERRTFRGGPVGYPAIAFSPDGQTLAQSAGPTLDDLVTLWDVAVGRARKVLAGTGQVRSLAFSPDGRTLAIGNLDGVIQFWDAATASQRATWQGHTKSVQALAFFPDGQTLVTADDTGNTSIRFWNLNQNPPQATREIRAGAHSLSFSPDGKMLAVGHFPALRLHDLATQKEFPTKTVSPGHGRAVAFSPDGKSIAVGVDARCVKLVDLNTWQQRTFAHLAPVLSLAIAPDGKTLASVSADANLKVWDLAEGADPAVISPMSSVTAIAYSPNNKTVAVGCSDKTVQLYDSATGRMQATFQGHTQTIRALAFSPDGCLVASGSGEWVVPYPGELKVWDVGAERELVSPTEHKTAVYGLAFSTDGANLAVGSLGGSVIQWDIAAGSPRTTFKTESVLATAYTPDGKVLAGGGVTGKVRFLDPVTGKERLSFRAGSITDNIWSVACSPNGKLLATGDSTGSIRLWQMPSGRLHASLRGHTMQVTSLSFLPDGKSLVTASEGGEVKLWDATTGQERITFKLGSLVAMAPNGQALAIANGSTVQILRAAAEREALARKNEFNPDDPDSPVAQNLAGDRLRADGQLPEAEQAYRTALARLHKLNTHLQNAPQYQELLARTCLSLSLLLGSTNRPQESQTAHDRGITLLEALAAQFPANPQYQEQLSHGHRWWAALLIQRGQSREAEKALREAAKVWEKSAPANPNQHAFLSDTYRWLVSLLVTTEDSRESENAILEIVKVLEKHAAEYPKVPNYRKDLARVQYEWAQRLVQSGRRQEAETAYRLSIEGYEKLATEFPDVPDYRHELGRSHNWLGILLASAGRLEEAEQEHRQALSLYETLSQSVERLEGERPRRELAWSYWNLGSVLKKSEHLQEAEAAYRQSLALCEKLDADFPADETYRTWAGNNTHSLALLLAASGRTGEADELYCKLLKLAPKNAVAHNNLAWMLATSLDPRFRDSDRAVELAKKAVDLDPTQGMFHNTLGGAHYRSNDWAAAVGALEKSVELRQGGDSFDWFFLAMAHWQLREKEEARKWYDRAIQWMEKNKPEDEELQRFRAEARELLGVKDK